MDPFTADRLHDAHLPAPYLVVLDKLQAFQQGCALPRAERDVDGLHALHDELLVLAREHLPATPGLLPRHRALQGFCMGVLMLAHYERTVITDDTPVVDTAGSAFLEGFQHDLAAGTDEGALRVALERAFGDEVDWAAIDVRLGHELRRLDARHAIIAELQRLFPLPEQTLELFTALYGDHPLGRDLIKVVRTGTSLFFALDHDRLPPDFRKRLELVRQSHFPTFGFFKAEHADAQVIDQLMVATGLPADVLLPKLTSMVSILPLAYLDQYLVHDAWGHQWQALLLPFEEDFRPLPDLRKPPNLTWAGLEDALLACMDGAERPFDTVLRTAFDERLVSGLSGPVSEILADVVEYKLGGALPSSSMFGSWPTKLDLSMADMAVYFQLGRSGTLLFSATGQGRYELEEELLARHPGRSRAQVEAAVEALRVATESALDGEYRVGFDHELKADVVRVNPWSRMALALLGLHTAVNDTYRHLATHERAWPPQLQHFHDLLVLSTGAFYQLDPERHFWHLDEFMVEHFEGLLDELIAVM